MCYQVVKPLLQERTRRKIDVLSGSGQDELLKVIYLKMNFLFLTTNPNMCPIILNPMVFLQMMDHSSLPHFCQKTSGSSNHLHVYAENCYSLDHPFHQQLYAYIKQQALMLEPVKPMKHGSVHVTLPEDADGVIAKTLESE